MGSPVCCKTIFEFLCLMCVYCETNLVVLINKQHKVQFYRKPDLINNYLFVKWNLIQYHGLLIDVYRDFNHITRKIYKNWAHCGKWWSTPFAVALLECTLTCAYLACPSHQYSVRVILVRLSCITTMVCVRRLADRGSRGFILKLYLNSLVVKLITVFINRGCCCSW